MIVCETVIKTPCLLGLVPIGHELLNNITEKDGCMSAVSILKNVCACIQKVFGLF